MIRKHTTYTMEIDDETYPLPFNPDSEPERAEYWGFYGYDYASAELLSEFKSTAFGNDPSAENRRN